MRAGGSARGHASGSSCAAAAALAGIARRPDAGTPPRGWARRPAARAQRGRRPLGEQAPAVQEADPIAQQLGLGQVVGREHAPPCRDRARRARSRAGSATRARRGRRSARRGSAPPDRAARRARSTGAGARRSTAPRSGGRRRRRARARARACRCGPSAAARVEAVQAGEVGEQLAPGEARVEPGRVGQEAEAPAHRERVVGDVEPGDPRAARASAQDAREDAQRRRLAGAVRAEQAVDLARRDRERQLGDRRGRRRSVFTSDSTTTAGSPAGTTPAPRSSRRSAAPVSAGDRACALEAVVVSWRGTRTGGSCTAPGVTVLGRRSYTAGAGGRRRRRRRRRTCREARCRPRVVVDVHAQRRRHAGVADVVGGGDRDAGPALARCCSRACRTGCPSSAARRSAPPTRWPVRRRVADRDRSAGRSMHSERGRGPPSAAQAQGADAGRVGSGVKSAAPAGGTGREPDLQHLVVDGRGLGGRDQQRVDRVAGPVAVGVDDQRLASRRPGCRRWSASGSTSEIGVTFRPAARLPSSSMRARRSNTCGTMLLSLGMSPSQPSMPSGSNSHEQRARSSIFTVAQVGGIEVGHRRDVVDGEVVADGWSRCRARPRRGTRSSGRRCTGRRRWADPCSR